MILGGICLGPLSGEALPAVAVASADMGATVVVAVIGGGLLAALAWAQRSRHEAARCRAELLAHERQLGGLLEHSPLPSGHVDEDGRIVCVNRAACRLFGRTDADLCGRVIEDVAPPAMAAELRERFARVTRLRVPEIAEDLVRLGSAESVLQTTVFPLAANGSGSGVGLVVLDVTQQRRRERVAAAHLRLIDFSAGHTVREVLQAFLDEAEALTGSQIGFFHFVEADQETLSLQAWSTNTLRHCSAVGADTHYPLSAAGVWIDCVRVRRPVIHNDYAALAHRRGLPEGHATVIRELVVPVFRENRIVAVFGVGNKPQDYGDQDLETVQTLADLAWDIFARKRGEEELRRSELLLDATQRLSRTGGWEWDTERQTMTWTNEAYRIHELDPAEVSPGAPEHIRRSLACYPPESQQQILAAFERCVTAGDPYDIECPFTTARGRPLWIRTMAHAIRRNGRVVKVVGNIIDITERKQAEQDRDRLISAIEQAAEAVVITDAKGTIQYVNPAFEAVSGYTREEAVGGNPRLLKSGQQDRAFYADLWGTLARGETWRGRLVNKAKDGRLFTEEVVISPVRNTDGQLVNYVAVKHDLTQTLALEAQVAHAQKMESVGRLAGGVAHDLNNLLTPILGYAEFLAMELAPDDPRRIAVAEIERAGGRARDLVRQLLAFGRKQSLAIKPLDLNTTIRDFAKLLRRTIREDIAIEMDLSPEPLVILADVGQIEQVLMNLAVNAADAMPDGGTLAIATDETMAAGEDGGGAAPHARMRIIDTGQGMDAATLAHIFEPFFSTKADHGTGLGLATVYGVVAQHDGQIAVESTPGQGTAFTILLPRCRQDATAAAPAVARLATTGGAETILLVEDDEGVRDLARVLLLACGYRVLVASDGSSALAAAAAHDGPLDLLLTDVVMPGMNGSDLRRELAGSRPELKVLFMSGYADDVIGHRGILNDGVRLLSKPFTAGTLTDAVRAALDGR